MKKTFTLLALFIYLTFSGNFLNAKTPATDSLRNREIDEITVYGLNANSLSLPYTEVGNNKIERMQPFTPADALQRAAGVALSRDGIWATSVNIRGISEQRLLILTDNDRLLTATDIAAALSTVDVNLLERIEVIKGAASVLYGTGAMGGVVNFVSYRPEFSAKPQINGKISTGFNTVNNLWANNAQVQLTNSDWYLMLNGSYRTAQNTSTPNGKISNSQFNDASWGLKGGVKYAENQQLHVNYNHFEAWDVGLPGGSAFPATAVVRYLGVKRNQFNGEYTFSDLTDVIKQLSLKAYTQNISRDVENRVNATTRILPSSLNITTGVNAVADLYYNDYNTIKIGAEAWTRDAKTRRVRMIFPSDTTFIGEQPTPNAKVLDAGVFAQYKWVVSPKYFTINTGLRLDYIRTANDTAFTEVFRYKIKDGKRTELAHNSTVLFYPEVSNEISYAAHLDFEYTPTSRNRFVLSLGNAYRVASIEERFKYIDQAGTLRVGNPDLKPEKGFFSNLEYLLKGRKILLKLDLFANYLFDLITEKSGTYNKGGTQVPALINTNVNKALFTGAEAELIWFINQNFSLNSNFSYVNARDRSDGSFLPQIPPMHGGITLNYHLDNLLDLSFSVLSANAKTDLATNETATDAYVIFNTQIKSTPVKLRNSAFTFFAGADNILNQTYYNFLNTARGINRLEPGRNIYAKVKWEW
jgi:hemoglobin/transferrin/lactoferrin receptor protein